MPISKQNCLAAVLIACNILSGCDRNEKPDGNSAQIKNDSPAAVAPAQNAPTPLNGGVHYDQGSLSIDVRNVSLAKLLQQIAVVADFRLEDNYRTNKTITVSLQTLPLAEALRVVLGDIPYKLVYEEIAPGSSPKIVALSVGVPVQDEAATLSALARKKAESIKLGSAKKQPALTLSREQLLAMTVTEQIEQISHLPPSPENLPLLFDVLQNHQQPEMRVAALAALENSEAPEAIHAMESALSDRDDEVVLAAIDSIEFAGDETQLSALSKLLKHTNPEIRSAAAEAMEFLR